MILAWISRARTADQRAAGAEHGSRARGGAQGLRRYAPYLASPGPWVAWAAGGGAWMDFLTLAAVRISGFSSSSAERRAAALRDRTESVAAVPMAHAEACKSGHNQSEGWWVMSIVIYTARTYTTRFAREFRGRAHESLVGRNPYLFFRWY